MRFLYFPNHDWMKMHSHIYMQEGKVEVPILARKFAEVSLRILHFGLWCLVRAHNIYAFFEAFGEIILGPN